MEEWSSTIIIHYIRTIEFNEKYGLPLNSGQYNPQTLMNEYYYFFQKS